MRAALFICIRVLVYVVLIAVSVPFVWQVTTGGTSMVVTGTSMRPTYERGDVVFVQKVTDPTSAFWKEGEIVAVAFSASSPEENRYVHRVERVLDDGRAVLKGDGNPEEDVSPVSLDQVVGVPVAVLHGAAANVYLFTQNWLGRIVIFGFGIIALILVEQIAHRDKKRRAAADTAEAGSDELPAFPTRRSRADAAR